MAQSQSITIPETPAYEFRLHPGSGRLKIEWKELWHYRDLLVLLVRRDFVAKYAQSVLGPLWFVVQPLVTTAVFTIVFGGIAKMPTSQVPPPLFYLCNQLAWIYFASCFNSTSMTFTANQHLFSKVYFPRLIVPISNVISNGFTLLIQFITFFVVFTYFKVTGRGDAFHLSWLSCLLPLLVIHIALLATGLGLLMSALTAKYRDLFQLSGFLVQLGMYASPVIYPLSEVPAKWRWLVSLNPLSFDIEAFRLALLGTGTVTSTLATTSLLTTLVILLLGLMLFAKVERTFVDVA